MGQTVKQPVLECKNISKTFPGAVALNQVNISVYPGEIHGLVGENGAGKSTLIKIISGVYTCDAPPKDVNPDEYGLFINGQKVHIGSVADAQKNKISTIHQELNIIPDLSVYENIFINNYERKYGLLDRKQMEKKAEEALSFYGADFHASDLALSLTPDRKKLIEVIRALMLDTKVLILDEPTSMLTDQEAARLFSMMKNVAAEGIGIIFISHNLNEIIELCDTISVLRDGMLVKVIDNAARDTAVDETVIPLMVGYKLKKKVDFVSQRTEEVLLQVNHLNYKNVLKDITFSVHSGEIVGITGLVGAGGRQLARTLFGYEENRMDSGEVILNGRAVEIHNTRDAYRNGIAYLTEDRKNEGLFLDFSVSDNIYMASLKAFSNKLGFLNKKRSRKVAREYIKQLRIKTPNENAVTESLSGGNQQKVVIAKILETEPEVLILAEPTVGVDVAAKEEIRKIIKSLAGRGKGAILITNEYAELDELCDKVLIMFGGQVIKELSRQEMNEETVMQYSLGGKANG